MCLAIRPGDTQIDPLPVISIADTSIPDNEVTGSDANNGSATATITITMTGVVDE